MIASATSLVPTAVGSSRVGFMSYVTLLALADHVRDRRLEPVGRLGLVEVAEHQHPREHLRHRVDLVLALVLRGRAVRRLEDRGVLAEVRARRHPEAADHAGGEVGEDVAVQVREHEHVVLLRPLDELHAHVVHDPVVELDVAVLVRDLARNAQPEAVGELHDVRLVHGRDLAAAVAARVVEGELEDAARAGDGDRLDRDAGVAPAELPALRFDPVDQLLGVGRALLVLDPGVEVLGVLADDDQVDVVEARAHALVGLARPHLRVEVETLAEADVDRAEAAADRRRDRALERRAVLADRVEHLVGQRVAAVLLHHVGAGLLDVPLELDAGRLEHAAGRLGQLRARAVARDQGYAMGHGADSTRVPAGSVRVDSRRG